MRIDELGLSEMRHKLRTAAPRRHRPDPAASRRSAPPASPSGRIRKDTAPACRSPRWTRTIGWHCGRWCGFSSRGVSPASTASRDRPLLGWTWIPSSRSIRAFISGGNASIGGRAIGKQRLALILADRATPPGTARCRAADGGSFGQCASLADAGNCEPAGAHPSVSGGSGRAGGLRLTGATLETMKISGTDGWTMFSGVRFSR